VTTTRDILAQRDAEAVASAVSFRVNWFLGYGRWEHANFDTLAEARAAKAERGSDEYGRVGGIYAVTASRQTIFVE
jgi:hypothetical protein